VSADLSVRAAGPGDTDRILALLRVSLGEGSIPREREYWQWKHERNPFGASPMLVAEADGGLVGLRAFMRWRWAAGSAEWPAVRAVDTATHPQWQGRGIFSRLTRQLVEQMKAEGVRFVFNTPNAKSRPGYLKMGWQSVGRTDLWIRPLRPHRLAGAALRVRRKGSKGPSAEPVASTAPTAADVLGTPALRDVVSRLAASADSPALTTPRSLQYLAWRYGDVPGFRYHALVEGDGEDGAAIVFRFKRRGALVELRLCEVLAGRGRRSRRMFGRVIARAASSAPADFAAAMLPATEAAGRLLLASRFIPAYRAGPILTVRPLASGANRPDPMDRASWMPSIGDLELF
jgi:GNAT superfamily N-acetyltransferase